uniref:C2H2-type domain-containing protein n=1 Tax=Macrostomum lignano TaxID=282301 RepID=A0A1I8FHM9_9PLAT
MNGALASPAGYPYSPPVDQRSARGKYPYKDGKYKCKIRGNLSFKTKEQPVHKHLKSKMHRTRNPDGTIGAELAACEYSTASSSQQQQAPEIVGMGLRCSQLIRHPSRAEVGSAPPRVALLASRCFSVQVPSILGGASGGGGGAGSQQKRKPPKLELLGKSSSVDLESPPPHGAQPGTADRPPSGGVESYSQRVTYSNGRSASDKQARGGEWQSANGTVKKQRTDFGRAAAAAARSSKPGCASPPDETYCCTTRQPCPRRLLYQVSGVSVVSALVNMSSQGCSSRSRPPTASSHLADVQVPASAGAVVSTTSTTASKAAHAEVRIFSKAACPVAERKARCT